MYPTWDGHAEIEHAVCNCIAFGSKNSALVLRKLSLSGTNLSIPAVQPSSI